MTHNQHLPDVFYLEPARADTNLWCTDTVLESIPKVSKDKDSAEIIRFTGILREAYNNSPSYIYLKDKVVRG